MAAFMGGFTGAIAGLVIVFLLAAIAFNKNDDGSDKQ